jgi:hypothetical protein
MVDGCTLYWNPAQPAYALLHLAVNPRETVGRTAKDRKATPLHRESSRHMGGVNCKRELGTEKIVVEFILGKVAPSRNS